MRNKLQIKKIHIAFSACLFTLFLGCVTTFAMTPIAPDLIDEFKADGRYDSWLEQVDRVKDYEISRNEKSNSTIATYNIDSSSPPQRPDTGNRWMPTEGNANALVICVDFPDQIHKTTQTVGNINELMFGTENPQNPNYPYESVSAYYKRSSYDKLNITGEVWGWYTASHNSSYYSTAEHAGNISLVQEVLNHYYSLGETYERFDADKDGYIDALYIRFANNTNRVGDFWWAYMYYGDMDTYSIGGMKVYGYVFMPYAESTMGWTKPSRVAIHETGHLLGLPDLYDGKTNIGPRGGLGGSDIMDLNMGDHNAFSKFVLGWIEPTIVSNGSQTIDLEPYANTPQTVLIMPSATGSPLEEYYLAQYITFDGNYSELSQLYTYSNLQYQTGSKRQFLDTGVAVWHVDGTSNIESNFGFEYNNTSSNRKIVKLVEADGRNDIENPLYASAWDGYKASSDDFFKTGNVISDTTNPNMKMYSGNNTGVNISFVSKTPSFARMNIVYSANNVIPSVLTAYYDSVSDEIHANANAALSEGTNYSNITLTKKNTGEQINCNVQIVNNSLKIVPQTTLIKGIRYILNIPDNALLNSNNLSNQSTKFNIIDEPLAKVVENGYIITDFMAVAKDINNVMLSSRCLSNEASNVYGYVSMFNATSQPKNVMLILALEENQKLKTLRTDIYTIPPHSPLDAEISYIPVENIDESSYKLMLWEDGILKPISEAYIFE